MLYELLCTWSSSSSNRVQGVLVNMYSRSLNCRHWFKPRPHLLLAHLLSLAGKAYVFFSDGGTSAPVQIHRGRTEVWWGGECGVSLETSSPHPRPKCTGQLNVQCLHYSYSCSFPYWKWLHLRSNLRKVFKKLLPPQSIIPLLHWWKWKIICACTK